MHQLHADEDYIKRARKDLADLQRLAVAGSTKIAEMRDAAILSMAASEQLMAQADAVLARG